MALSTNKVQSPVNSTQAISQQKRSQKMAGGFGYPLCIVADA